MTLGIALLLIFILYLIDKHNRWRQAVKVVVALVVLCLLAVGGFFGWVKYEAWQEVRQEARREAEAAAQNAKQEAEKKAVLAKTCKEWEAKHPLGTPVDKLYGKWDDGTKMPVEGVTLGVPEGCFGPLEVAYSEKLPKPTEHGPWEDYAPKPAPRLRHVKANSDTDLVTTEYGSLICGHVAKGETVTLLEDSGLFVKVRTKTGKVGWAGSHWFEVVE